MPFTQEPKEWSSEEHETVQHSNERTFVGMEEHLSELILEPDQMWPC